MRVNEVRIVNYRSHVSTTIGFDGYTALIGANGAGKSSLFYALRWFFDGGPIAEGDLSTQASVDENSSSEVSVSVTFDSLTDADRLRLGEYGRGEKAHFTRTWTRDDVKSKVFGNALAGPGFSDVRRESRVTFKRKLYATLLEGVPTLPSLGGSSSVSEIDQALADWEGAEENAGNLASVPESDANHLFGINGRNVIGDCIQLILVPAATDITANVGVSGKGSTLSDLIGAVTTAASAKARAAWAVRYAKEIEELNATIRVGVEAATTSQANRINARLATFIPDASVQFATTVPDWTPKGDPSVSTLVKLGESTGDLANQGHGTQRAVMIAMFQSMAPDKESTIADDVPLEGESLDEYESRIDSVVQNLPTLLICIEEPEIYQHPVRARAFARVLSELAEQANIQVAVATHSPYFVRPSQFENLRRLKLSEGRTEVAFTTLKQASSAAAIDPAKFALAVERHLPTAFSEGFFADAVVLVEGDTDKACLEAAADQSNLSLDVAGVSVLHVGGKNELRMAYELLSVLDVPVFVVVDGDADRAARKHNIGTPGHATARKSNAEQTNGVVSWLPTANGVLGIVPFAFEDPTVVTTRYAIWRDDLESELENWPSFLLELDRVDGALRDKKASIYRAAAMAADAAELPTSIRATIDAIHELARA